MSTDFSTFLTEKEEGDVFFVGRDISHEINSGIFKFTRVLLGDDSEISEVRSCSCLSSGTVVDVISCTFTFPLFFKKLYREFFNELEYVVAFDKSREECDLLCVEVTVAKTTGRHGVEGLSTLEVV